MNKAARRIGQSSRGPVRMLQADLQSLRRELRATLRAYSARLEISLAETTAAVAASAPADELSGEQWHRIRDLNLILRNRKLKPEKGRRKDLRKLDSLIEELAAVAQNGHGR